MNKDWFQWQKKASAQILSCVRLFVTPWTVSHQAPLSMRFSRQEYWTTAASPRDLLQGIFPTQELNLGLLHCRQVLYQLGYRGSLLIFLVVVNVTGEKWYLVALTFQSISSVFKIW